MDEPYRSYWGVLPGEIVHAKNLTIAAKYLYVILSSMAHKNGFCWPSNETLATEMQLSKRRVVELLGMIRDAGFIKIVFQQEGKEERRYIYCGMFPDRIDSAPDGCEKSHEGYAENCTTPCEKSHSPMRDLRIPIEVEKQIEKQSENTPYSPPEGDASTGKKKRRANKGAPDWKPDRFEGFWRLYPVKKSKQAAIRAWDLLRPDDDLLAVMGRSLLRQLSSPEWKRKIEEEDGQGIPYPATWINGRRWEDEDKPARHSALSIQPNSEAPHLSHTEIINGEEVMVYDR